MRRFFGWRREQQAIREGAMEFIAADDKVLAFRRSHEGETITCAFNFSGEEADIGLPEAEVGAPMEGHGFGWVREGEEIRLPAYGAFFARAA